jgi:hypothetical protein
MEDTNCTNGASVPCNSDTTEAAFVLGNFGNGGVDDKDLHQEGAEEEEELEIPQRFTKSGRKRAVSFPLKVGSRTSI